MREHTFDRSVETHMPVAEPHFDDERTLQSARRVVPLEKIDAEVRQRRKCFLGGAFAIAMMLGAASALLASYLKLRNVSSPATEISQVVTSSAPVAVSAEPVASNLPVGGSTEEVENTEQSATPVTPKKEAAVKRQATVKYNPDVTEPPAVRGMSEEDELNRIREAVLLDSWQERRARRAAKRERRSRVDHHERDLSNLDEIFEGPSRRP